MNLLFIGDVMGARGRGAIATPLPALRPRRDLVIANAENVAGFTADAAPVVFAPRRLV